ncbi:MAG: hypothetical protein J0L94_16650 [Rhodothermia bacterium]|nr:hypothetical protein [Rhodothermia bacterium]
MSPLRGFAVRWKRISTKRPPLRGFAMRWETDLYEDVTPTGLGGALSWLKPKVGFVAENPTLKHGVIMMSESMWQRRPHE